MFRLGVPSFDIVALQEGKELPSFPSATTKVIGGKNIDPSYDLRTLAHEKGLTRKKFLNTVVVEDNGERACHVQPDSTILLEVYMPAGKEMFKYKKFGGSQEEVSLQQEAGGILPPISSQQSTRV